MIARPRVLYTGYLTGLFRLEAAQLVSMSFVSDMDSMHCKQRQSMEIHLSLLIDLVYS